MAETSNYPGTNPGTPLALSSRTIGTNVVPHVALVQDREVIDAMNAIAGWAALDSDTTTIATATKHILGSASLSFAKANTGANSTFAGVEKTITSVDLSRFGAGAAIEVAVNVDITLVASMFVRLGTDSSNYSEWLVDDSAIATAVWDLTRIPLFTGAADGGAVTGDGWDMSAVTYVSVGFNFDAETNTLADILFDHVAIVGAQMTVT